MTVSESRLVSAAVGTPDTEVDFVELMGLFTSNMARAQPREAVNNVSDHNNVHQSPMTAERVSTAGTLELGYWTGYAMTGASAPVNSASAISERLRPYFLAR